jgi:DNA-directed RNA polymerase specialized sigma subunit
MTIEKACDEHGGLVVQAARSFALSRPAAAFVMDCESEAWMAFVVAYQKYDEERHGTWSTYLWRRVYFHLLDKFRILARKREQFHEWAEWSTRRLRSTRLESDAVDARLDNPEGFQSFSQAKKYVYS